MEQPTTDHFSQILEQSPLLLIAFDPEGSITLAQGLLLTVLETSPGNLVGRSTFELGISWPLRKNDIERALSGRTFSSVREAGSRTYELRYAPQFDQEGSLMQVICLGFDISGRHVATSSLRASETRFQNAFSHAAIGFALIGIDGRFIRTNPALHNTLGRSSSDLERINSQDLLLEEGRKNWHQAIQQLLSGEIPDRVLEARFHSTAGEPRWMQVNLSVVLDVENHPMYFFSQYQDIHERKLAEKSLQQYTDRLKFLHHLDKAILAASSLEEVGTAVVAGIRALIPCQRVSITLFDHEMKIGSYLAYYSQTTLGPEDLGEFRFSNKILDLLRADGVRHVRDISGIEKPSPMEQKLLDQGLNTYVNVPLGLHGEIYGTLNIGAREVNFFTEEHLEIAKEIADPLAVAIQQARLDDQIANHSRALEQRVEDLRASQRFLAMLNDITHAALQSQDFKKMLQLLADRIGELFNANGCFITLWDEVERTATPAAAFGAPQETIDALGKVPGEGTMTESVLNAEVALVAEDIRNSPYISPKNAAMSTSRTVLGLPLIAGREKLGAVLIAYTEVRQFTPDEIIRGEQTARHIALAVAKAKLLEAERKRRQEAETLRIVTDALVSTLDLDQVLDLILDQLAVVIDYDSASIMLWEGDYVRCVAGRGFANPDEVIGKLFPTKDSLFSQILETGQALWLNDPSHDPRFSGWGGTDAIRSWMALPLIAHGKFVAYMTLDSYVPEAYGPAEAAMVQPFANQAAQAIDNARLFDWVQRQALTDSLTNLYNRRGLFDIGRREVERARRFDRPLTAIMLDIDLFKKVNDEFGHYTGDQVLRVIADRCGEELRNVDLFARYGGEEFAALLPETELDAAQAIAERLRCCIGDEPIETDRGTHVVTISLGIAQITEEIKDLTDLLDTADQALYSAKQSGRNCVMVAEQN